MSIDESICNGCGRAEKNMVRIYSRSHGDKHDDEHYCPACWSGAGAQGTLSPKEFYELLAELTELWPKLTPELRAQVIRAFTGTSPPSNRKD